MASDGMRRKAARLSPKTRTTLRIVGPILLLVGFYLFMVQPLMWSAQDFDASDPRDPSTFEDKRPMSDYVLSTLGGFVVLVVGMVSTQLGYLRLAAEVAATESETAVEHAAGSAGRGLAGGLTQAGLAGGAAPPNEVVKVRCRGCGYLDSEDARFCSGCGTAM